MRSISKSLVVGAVAASCAYATAGTVKVGTIGIGYGLESALASPSTASIKIDGNNGAPPDVNSYVAGELVFTADNLSVTSTRLRITSNRVFGSADAHPATIACSANNPSVTNTTAVFTLSTASSSTEVIYDLTNRGTDLTTDISCAIPTLAFTKTSFATSGDISVGYNVVNINSGFTLETATQVKVASVGPMFTMAVSSVLDAVIDVQQNRLTFASGTDTVTNGALAYNDTFAVTVTPVARQTVGGSFNRTFNLTLTAGTDFGFLEEPAGAAGGGSCTLTTGTGRAYANTGTLAVTQSFECKTLTLTGAAVPTTAATTYTIGLGRSETTSTTSSSVTTASSTPFAAQAYTASYGMTGGATGAFTLQANTSAAAGSWTLNGTSVTLQYVPVSSAVNLQLFVSNSGAAGTASFTATNHAGVSCTGTLGPVGAGSTSLGSALKRALLGTPGTGETSTCATTFASEGRAAVTITTTTPSQTTRMHSAFSTSDGVSRQVIINSGN